MSNKSTSKTVKAMRTTFKFVVFAILFAMVFGIVFTSETLSEGAAFNESLNVNDVSHAANPGDTEYGPKGDDLYIESFTKLLDDERGAADASKFVSSGKNFPQGAGPWKTNPIFFRNTKGYGASLSYVVKNGPGASVQRVAVSDTPLWKDGSTFGGKDAKKKISYGVGEGDNVQGRGFSIYCEVAKEESALIATLKFQISPFIKQLIYDDRYIVQARVYQKNQFMQYFKAGHEYRYMKTKVHAGPEGYQPTMVGAYVNGNDFFKTSINGILEEEGFTTSNTWIGHWTGTGDGDHEHGDTAYDKTVTLTKDNPELYCTYSCSFWGSGDDGEGATIKPRQIIRVWDMFVEYTISKNTETSTDKYRNDGGAPKLIGAEAAPYRATNANLEGHKWPVYIENDEVKKQLATDRVFNNNNEQAAPLDNIALLSYINSKTSDYYKKLDLTYQDQYNYIGDDSERKDEVAGGLKQIRIVGSTTIDGQDVKLRFGENSGSAKNVFDIDPQDSTIKNKTYYIYGTTDTSLGSITVLINTAKGVVDNVTLSYKFLENLKLSVSLCDFSLDTSQSTLETEILVDGIDTKAPKAPELVENDPSILNNNSSGITKWFNDSLLNIKLNPNDENFGDLGASNYLWFLKITKGNSFDEDGDTNSVTSLRKTYSTLDTVLNNTTFIQVQGINTIDDLYFDFLKGDLTVPGRKTPINMGVDGVGYYCFDFYTIDLAGNIAGSEPVSIYVKADYIAPRYEIVTKNLIDTYFNNKVSGDLWSYNAFSLRVSAYELLNAEKPLKSISGNYIKFTYKGVVHTVSYNKHGILAFDGMDVLDNLVIPNEYNGIDFNIGYDNTNSNVEIIFDFKVQKDKLVSLNSEISFDIGVGDGTEECLQYNDPKFKYKKSIDSSSAQERGIKILIEEKTPKDVAVESQDNSYSSGLVTSAVYKQMIDAQTAKLQSRVWNTSGVLNLNIDVPQNSTIFVVVANANKFSKEITDDFTADINKIFEPVKGQKLGGATLDFITLKINEIARNYNNVIISTSDTSSGYISNLAIPLYVEKFGVGIRNIYVWAANEAGRISTIAGGKVLVDNNVYELDAVISEKALKYFYEDYGTQGFKQEDIIFDLYNRNNTKSKTFRRGEKVAFKFGFNNDFVPFALIGPTTFKDNSENVLYSAELNDKAQVGEDSYLWSNNNESLLFDLNRNKITFTVDSLTDINSYIKGTTQTKDKTDYEKASKLTFKLQVKKKVIFGLSGLIGNKVVASLNKNGTNVPIWASYERAISRHTFEGEDTGLDITYKVAPNGTGTISDGLPIAAGTYIISAQFNKGNILDKPEDPYYVSNIEFSDIIFKVELPKISINALSIFGDYGDSPEYRYVIKDMDGNVIELKDLTINGASDPSFNITNAMQGCFEIDTLLNVPLNRLPSGEYVIVGNDTNIANLLSSDYQVKFIEGKYTVRPRKLKVNDYAIKVGENYVPGVKKYYKANNPEVYFFIDKSYFVDNHYIEGKGLEQQFTSAELETIFLNCDYIGVEGNNLVFKDTLRSLQTEVPVDKNSLPKTYVYKDDATRFVLDNNFTLSLPANKVMLVERRSGIILQVPEQPIFYTSEDLQKDTKEGFVYYKGNLNYTIDDKNPNKDLLEDTGYIEGLTFKLTASGEQYVIDAVEGDLAYGDTIEVNAEPITIIIMDDYPTMDAPNFVVYTLQRKVVEVEYSDIKYNQGFLVGKNIKTDDVNLKLINLDDFNTYFDFIIYEKQVQNGITSWIKNQQLSDVTLRFGITNPGSQEQTNIGLGPQSIAINKSSLLTINNAKQNSVAFYESNVQFKVVPKAVYVIPEISKLDEANNVFGYTFLNITKPLFTTHLVDKDNNPVTIEGEVKGSFDKALFNGDRFVRYGTSLDGVLTEPGYYYGVVCKTPFTITNKNYKLVYDDSKNVFNETISIRDARIVVNPYKITITDESFGVSDPKFAEKFVDKEYDGTDKYYNADISKILNNITTSFADGSYITFNIAYTGIGALNQTVDVIIKQIEVKGNPNNFILDITYTNENKDGVLDSFIFDVNKQIKLKKVTILANDIVVTKSFDNNVTVDKDDVILPSSLQNIKYTVLSGQYDSKYISDARYIDTLVIKLELAPTDGLFEIVSPDITISENGTVLTIKGKKAAITKRTITGDDIDSISAVNREYKEKDKTVNLIINFTNAFKVNVIESLKVSQSIPDDLGIKLQGLVANENAGKKIPVTISDIAYSSIVEGAVFNSYLFDLDMESIKSKGKNITVDINKALITPRIEQKSMEYKGKTIIPASIKVPVNGQPGVEKEIKYYDPTTDLLHNNQVIAKIEIQKIKLYNKDKEDKNVVINENALPMDKYKHSVMVEAKLTNPIGNDLTNYTLGGYIYNGNNYVLYEANDPVNNTLNKVIEAGKNIKFQLLDVFSITPREIEVNNENIQMKNSNGGKYTKVYDGNTDANFEYIPPTSPQENKILNNEAKIEISASYNSKDANVMGDQLTGQKQISFNEIKVVPVTKEETNDPNFVENPGCANNYLIKNELQSVFGPEVKIVQREVYVDSIELYPAEYNDSLTRNVTPGDIKNIQWKNSDGSKSIGDANTGFINDDINYIKLYINDIEYKDITDTNLIKEGYCLEYDENSSFTVKLKYTKQTGVLNYKFVKVGKTPITSYLSPRKVYVDLQLSAPLPENITETTYSGIDKIEGISISNFNNVPNGISSISARYASPNAGSTKIIFDIVSDKNNKDTKYTKFINTGISSINAIINPKPIYYGLNKVTLQYGDNNIVPNYIFYKEDNAIEQNKYGFSDGNILDGEKIIVKKGELLLPECIATTDGKGIINGYVVVNNGSKGNYEFKLLSSENGTGIVAFDPREIYVYALGQNKVLGTDNPNIKLQYSNATNSFDSGFIGYDNESNVFNYIKGKGADNNYYPVFTATYELFNADTNSFVENIDVENTSKIVYGLRVKVLEYEDEGDERVAKLVNGKPSYVDLNTMANGYTTLDNRYTVKLRNALGNRDFLDNVLTVSTPKVDLTIKDNYVVDYNGRNQLPNIFNSSIEQHNIIYQISKNGNTESEDVLVIDGNTASEGALVIDAGEYKIQAFETFDLKKFGNDKYVYEDSDQYNASGYPIYTGKNSMKTECTLTINPAAPIISYDLGDTIKIGDSVDKTKIIFNILHKKDVNGKYVPIDGVSQDVIDDLRTNITVQLEYKAPNSKSFVELDNDDVFEYAGVYNIKMILDETNLPNFLHEEAMSQTIVESIKVFISEPTIAENLFIEKEKNDYVKATVTRIQEEYANRLNEVKKNLRVQYLGGNANQYVSTITSVGVYQYRFIIADKNGAYNPNYVVLFDKDETLAQGKDLLISRKVIGNSNKDSSKIQASLKSGKPIGIDYITYNLMVDSYGFQWVEINDYVNNMGGLKDVNSKLTAVIRMESKDGNGNTNTSKINQQLNDSKDQMSFKVQLPENLNTAKNLQVFYINKEGHLEEMTQYSINDGCISYDLDGIYDLVFVTEEVKALPAYAIALIVIGVLAAVGIAVAIAIVTIRSKKEQ